MDCGGDPPIESAELVVEPPTPTKAQEFQEIIRTRTEERRETLEQNRLETVKLIENMRLRNARESKQKRLFGLPNEVWIEILSLVKDPKDLKSMWGVHPRFRELSGESQSQELLLSKLLEIRELPHLWKDHEERMKTCKTFRTFSKGMRITTDRCFESHSADVLNQAGGSGQLIFQYNEDTFAGTAEMELRKLKGILSNFREGPVASRAKLVFHRTIHLRVDPTGLTKDQFDDFLEKLILLLETIGAQIWNVFFTFVEIGKPDGYALSLTDAYLLSQCLVALMPNVRWLTLVFYSFHNNCCCRETLIISPETFQQHPFPRLSHLEKFELGLFLNCQQKSEILAGILQSNLHVKTLDFEMLLYDNEGGGEKFSFFTDEIQSLWSKLDLDGYFVWMDHGWTTMPKSFANPNWKLRFINLFFKADLLLDVFNFVNHFPTLEDLALILSNPVNSSSLKNTLPYLKLPNLTDFDMEFELESPDRLINYSYKETTYFFFSLQFLLNSKKLKNLRFVHTGKYYNSLRKLRRFMINHESGEETINFRGGFRDLTYSNLWEVFPELRYVQHSDWKNVNEKLEDQDYSIEEIRRKKLLCF